jgi:hypothetical protein
MANETLMSVQVQTGQIRNRPSFLGQVVAEVGYARQVRVMEERAGWMRVAVPGTSSQGWMHGSALSPKRIVLQAGDEEVRQAATTGEIALAGKGFTEQVEREFAAQNSDADFAVVNRMEASGPAMADIIAFARKGRLHV